MVVWKKVNRKMGRKEAMKNFLWQWKIWSVEELTQFGEKLCYDSSVVVAIGNIESNLLQRGLLNREKYAW